MTKRIRHLDTKLKYAKNLTWVSYFLFLVSMWTGGILGGVKIGTMIVLSLPLILFLPGMARGNYKSLAMLSFVTLMYFIPLVVNVGRPDFDVVDITSVALICILFTSSMLFSRWAQYDQAGLGET